MIRYLLGELSDAERGEFERVCFADDGAFEELLAVEAELMDDYVRGALGGRAREQFEKRLLGSPARRDELELARLITRQAGHDAAKRGAPAARDRTSAWQAFIARLSSHRQTLQLSFATILILVACVGAWMLWSRATSRRQPEQTASLQPPAFTAPADRSVPAEAGGNAEQPSPDEGANTSRAPQNGGRQSPAPPTRQTPPAAPRRIVPTFALVAGFERGEGGVNELKLPRGAERARLKINLAGGDYQSFRAALKRVGTQQTLMQRDLKASPTKSGQVLTLELPTSVLPDGDYLLTLSGSGASGQETIANYFLRVSRP